MALAKILCQLVPHHLGLRSPRRNVHVLSSTLHAVFNSAFNWTGDIWSMYSSNPHTTFSSWSILFNYRSKNVILLPFNKCYFHFSIISDSWHVPNHFVSKIVKQSVHTMRKKKSKKSCNWNSIEWTINNHDYIYTRFTHCVIDSCFKKNCVKNPLS